MNRHGGWATPIWITEVGSSTGGRRWGKSNPFKATELSQARFLTRTYRMLIASQQRLGLERVVWHTWRNGVPGSPWTLGMGLIHFDESAKPSLAAYARLPR